ncbi:hypothetical protein PPROV_000748000 [Pycnococcus provasolii]|uniref:Condensin-2 complex subunit H2 n=2 Tax=Pycnococcus provasolii TaxID=41880 RepID=A0A830HPR9_9CHLO|nr:hypothetical protein PPROV_000748000 [Pycnococcus provasolii]
MGHPPDSCGPTPVVKAIRRSLSRDMAAVKKDKAKALASASGQTSASSSSSSWLAFMAPIKDLAENWNIDIAHDLEDYLDQVAAMNFEFVVDENDNPVMALDAKNNEEEATEAENKKVMNFAQAAMVIQGSACVYSKKVEYLHGLVYATLSHITDTQREALAAARRRNKGGGDGDEDDEDDLLDFDDDEDVFLNLDDVIKEATNIDMEEDDDGGGDENLAEEGGEEKGSKLLQQMNRAPLVDALREGVGNELASDNQSFKVASCALHASGALLLDVNEASRYGDNLQMDAMQDEDDGGIPFGGGFDDDDDDDFVDDAAPMPMADEDEVHGAVAPPTNGGDEQRAEEEEEEVDPFERADPHAESNKLRLCPFRRGARPKLRATYEALVDAEALPAGENADQVEQEQEEKAAAICVYKALCVWHVRRHLATVARRSTRRHRHAASAGPDVVSVNAAQQDGGAASAPGFDDDDDAYVPLGGGGFDDDDDDDDGGFGGGYGDDDFDNFDAIDDGAAPAHTADGEPCYADLVRQHVSALVAAAAEEERQSQIAARVADWRKTMEATLEAEDETFDVAATESVVLQRLEGAGGEEEVGEKRPAPGGGELPFAELARGAAAKEVCRLFAAVLQLAVDGRVELSQHDQEVGDGGNRTDERGFAVDFAVTSKSGADPPPEREAKEAKRAQQRPARQPLRANAAWLF